MEKILVNNYGDVISFDTETNSLTLKFEGMSFDNLFKVRKDGQVITDNEVIDVKAGEWIVTFHKWGENKCRSNKVVVIYDNCTTAELDNWFAELNKEKVNDVAS